MRLLTTGTEDVQSLLLISGIDVPGGNFTHQILFIPEHGLTGAALQSIQNRFLSHCLVDLLPERSLPELVETLRGIAEFYAAPATQPSLLPPRREVRAKAGERYTRPDFHIVED
jgi:hypothetical protein